MANGKIRFDKQSGGVTNTEVMLQESGALEFNRGWENQEVVYGLFQGIALWYTVIFLV